MKKRSIFWGIIFILLAVYLIISRLDLIPKLPVFSILVTLVLVYIMIMGIRQMNFGQILIPLALIGWQYDEYLGIEELTPWPLLLAAVLVAIGLDMIFRNIRKEKRIEGSVVFSNHVENGQDGSVININSAFCGNNKYVNSDHFSAANIDTSFGQCNVYFDNAIMDGNHCVINVDNSFGETNLYFPHTWRVNVARDCAFGDVKIHGTGSSDADAPFVQVNADVAFGTLNIYFN